MSTYSATVRVDGDMLTIARPLTAPEPVGDMIDSVVYDMTQVEGRGYAAGVVSVEFTVETSDDSGTPIGDSLTSTSSQPLEQGTLDGELAAEQPAAAEPATVQA